MKKYMIVLVLLFLVAVPLTAQNEDIVTNHIVNGRFWKSITPHERTAVIAGFIAGVRWTVTTSTTCSKEAKERLPNLTYAELRDAVDHFYSEPENVSLPVPVGIEFVEWKTRCLYYAGMAQGVEMGKKEECLDQVPQK
jgi:hypothetical protein